MSIENSFSIAWFARVFLLLLPLLSASAVTAQGPSPEVAPTLFPGGGLVSYSSTVTTRGLMPRLSGGIPLMPRLSGGIPRTARPTFSHEGDFNFKWGFHRDFDLTVLIPIVTNHFETQSTAALEGTGLGDAMVLLRYRFYRRDSERGTTQASVTFGPKIPTGRTNLNDTRGVRLPVGLQPGSGSVDLLLAADWTCTGLFHLKRLVADEDFRSVLRSQGTQATRLGSDLLSRFWLSYRPYQTKQVAREWFIGPALTWLHAQDERIAGISQSGSGGDVLLAGVATFLGVRPGMHVWLGMDWDIAHSTGAAFVPVRRHFSFGITRQFRLQR